MTVIALHGLRKRGDTGSAGRAGNLGSNMASRSTSDDALDRGDALIVAGDIDGALAALHELTGEEAAWEPGVAWRIGLVHYLLRGSPRDALTGMSRGRLHEERTADEALLLGWLAAAYWALGDIDACTDYSGRAIAAAEAADDDRARAAAHVALAMHAMLTGDRISNAAHYGKALRCAEAAADHIQLIRILLNRSSRSLDEGCFDDALADLRLAAERAELIGNTVLLAVALTNEGDTLNSLGRLAGAEKLYRRAIELCQQAESGKICFGLLGLGEVLRRCGQPALARAAYEEVIPLAEQHGHLQVLVPALAGLSGVLAEGEPATALALAERARDEAVGPFVTVALLALARATLAVGDLGRAVEFADEAQRSARNHRDRTGVAQALELQAELCDEWERAGRYLAEARSIWSAMGAGFDADRVTVALSRLPVVTAEAVEDSYLAADRLAAAGLQTPCPGTGTAEIRTLGRFEVLVAGRPMPPAAWQSRKARDLLRLLVARRGRPAMREELTELLWADERGGGLDRRGHRLATALSIIRGVLDGNRPASAESVVIADGGSVALDTSRVVIDFETFMRQADHGLQLRRRGRDTDARTVLVAAERLYTGDFLEGESYEDWSAMPREQARATYLRVGRALAEDATRAGDTKDAIHYLLRILAMDSYDEQSHLDLIDAFSTAGQHGEARRARDRYVAAMRQIGVGVRQHGV
ncbi:DNA-binding SARP family transcriptional activator [Allocatelliglobosispora scoriae]|uniref:DNA-binding SARP family transcriptional activator n=1 Tax=Allocatelliglobosispora scoriae TaxID=643052 RepID=A0A841BQK4_9ACTN|nr:BTAD domain-containing putative transcriptional regulator [Allocatelliglobosispora scoriae]MBB5869100.1 DNA-binding SARP family transcriptional activator [Allocatelliglobosispora scoriae]